MNKLLIFVIAFMLAGVSVAAELTPEMEQFAVQTARDGRISKKAVLGWLKRAVKTDDVIALMDRQAESKEWKDYKPNFINRKKVVKGKDFLSRYPKTLQKAERIYGVDPYVIVAILGIETDYGTYDLSHRAMDALFTLAFYYPRRAEYFKQELAALMIYAYRNRLDPYNLKSSYAGAVGMPQFMPSNIMKYGKEFSGDGRINIFKSGADSIGSIANYLHKHGWDDGKPIAVKADVKGDSWKRFADQGWKPKYTVAEMKQSGVLPSKWVSPKQKGALITLTGDEGTEFWIVFNNFYAITRYNPSSKYAMAVTILSKHLQLRRLIL